MHWMITKNLQSGPIFTTESSVMHSRSILPFRSQLRRQWGNAPGTLDLSVYNAPCNRSHSSLNSLKSIQHLSPKWNSLPWHMSTGSCTAHWPSLGSCKPSSKAAHSLWELSVQRHGLNLPLPWAQPNSQLQGNTASVTHCHNLFWGARVCTHRIRKAVMFL